MDRMIRGVLDASLSLLYPTVCRVCDRMIESWNDGVACETCWLAVVPIKPTCAKCGFKMRSLPEAIDTPSRRCGLCEEFAFDRARACGLYAGALRESVLWLKSTPHVAPRLRRLLRRSFEQMPELESFDSIVPVPLHPSRLAERGFNQAAIIARALAAEISVRVDEAALVRVKRTEMHRVGMGAAERARSLERSFVVRAPRLVKNRSLLAVDDIMTTGGTAHEVARTLLDAGASHVSILTIARAANEFIQ